MKHVGDTKNRVGTISQSSSKTTFKLFWFAVGLSQLENLSFAQASARIASANAKKLKWQILGPNTHRAKNQNFRNTTNYIPLNAEFYTDHYLQKDYTWKVTVKKILAIICCFIQRHCFEQKWKCSRINFLCSKNFTSFIF